MRQVIQQGCRGLGAAVGCRRGPPPGLFEQPQFSGRGQDGGGDFLARYLSERVEIAQRFNFVPEKLQADRPGTGGRIDVEDAAPQGDLAFVGHLHFRFVALVLEPFHEVQRVSTVVAGQLSCAAGQVRG